jgi:CheY-like chemotaxis protein
MDTTATSTFQPNTLKGQRVLIVDDTKDNRLLLTHFLRSLGTETLEATNGVEALEKISQEHFDLVLMDLQMPLMDGYEAMERLKASNYPTPVIAITANVYSEEKSRCEKAGFCKCLSKPIDRWSLLKNACDSILGGTENH